MSAHKGMKHRHIGNMNIIKLLHIDRLYFWRVTYQAHTGKVEGNLFWTQISLA